jgi:hypothetical protein
MAARTQPVEAIAPAILERSNQVGIFLIGVPFPRRRTKAPLENPFDGTGGAFF